MKNNTEQQEEIQWGGFLNEFLWVCAGVNRKVLRQCPTEYAKYAGTGGTILFTALMAMLSGGYAFSFVFNDSPVAIPILFGVFWGLLIFNLDRFIVNTMYSDGKYTISWGELGAGLPRIIMAIFLGLVISTPLELRIYKDSIDPEIEHLQEREMEKLTKDAVVKLKELEEELESVRYTVADEASYIETDNVQLKQLYAQRDAKNAEIQKVESKLRPIQAEIIRMSNNTELTDDTKYNSLINKRESLKKQRAQIYNELNTIKGQINAISQHANTMNTKAQENKDRRIADLEGRIRQKEAEIQNIKAANKEVVEKYRGFQAQMMAFNNIKANDPGTNITAWLIRILFIIIEVAPTFFKMMMSSGPYDDRLRAEMHRVRILSDKQISDINDAVNASVEISTKQNEDRIAAEVLANKELLNTIAEAQSQILSEAIALWKEEELRKVRENPSAYIQSAQESAESLTPNA